MLTGFETPISLTWRLPMLWTWAWAPGEVVVACCADDITSGTPTPDAIRFLVNLRERLAMFGRELHPDKTSRIESGRLAKKPET